MGEAGRVECVRSFRLLALNDTRGLRDSKSLLLTRRPAEGASTKQMQVQMKHRLPGTAPIVQNGAIALEQIAFARQLRRHELQLAEYGLIGWSGFIQRRQKLAWANKDMRGRFGAGV